MVLAPGAAKRAVPADDAEGRFKTADAAIGSWPAHRRAGFGPIGERPDPCRDGGGRAATRSACDSFNVPGVVYGTEMGKGRGAAVAKLIEIGLANDNRTGGV